MERYARWRSARPGRWLTVALAAEVATYATADARSAHVMPWLLLDLWLAHRVWRGGATALAWFRGLQVLGAALFGLVQVVALWDDSVHTTAGPGTVALFVVSAWCLLAPALSRHVAAARGRAREAAAAT